MRLELDFRSIELYNRSLSSYGDGQDVGLGHFKLQALV